MTRPTAIAMEASTFYRDVSRAMVDEAKELRADEMPDSADYVPELAGIALVASYQELNPHDAPDVPWCLCETCQTWLFAMKWARIAPEYPRG